MEDKRTTHKAENYNVIITENDQGIIVDVYDRQDELLRTDTYWNE